MKIFDIYKASKNTRGLGSYNVVHTSTGDRYYVTITGKTKGYPDKAEHEYKGECSMLDPDTKKWIRIVPYKSEAHRALHWELIRHVTHVLRRDLDLQQRILEDEAEATRLMLESDLV